MIEPSEPRRRWLRFSLRGLLIFMAVLSLAGAYVVHEWRIVQERRSAIRAILKEQNFIFTGGLRGEPSPKNRVSWLRRSRGDFSVKWWLIGYPEEVSAASIERLKKAYPEAVVVTDSEQLRKHFPNDNTLPP